MKSLKLSTIIMILAAVFVGLFLLIILGSCGTKVYEPFKDAPRSEVTDNSPMDVIEMSDGFTNVGTKCDRYGNRVYVGYHGDSPYASIFVVANDTSCKK